jgi:hypothetical protein
MTPHVDPHRRLFAERKDFGVLEKTQQFGLNVERQFADLVQEQRAAVGCTDHARIVRRRSGEGAAPVTNP